MPTILTCQRCGAANSVSKPNCRRCGQALTFVDEDGQSISTATLIGQDRQARLARRLVIAAVVVIAVAAVVTLGMRLRTSRASAMPSLTDVLRAPPQDEDEGQVFVPQTAPGLPDETPATTATAFDSGDLNQALELGLDALRTRPTDPTALNNVGQILVALGRPGEAMPYLERAVAGQPAEASYRFNLAVAFNRAGEPDRAAALLRDIAASAPGDVRVHHNLGLTLRQLGLDAEAADQFKMATAASPSEAPAWLGLGLSLDRLDRPGEAADALERYLSLHPSDPEADAIRKRVTQLRNAEAKATEAGSVGLRLHPR